MSIIYDTKWALLALFPEQAELEKVKEEEARIKAEQEALEPPEEEAEAPAETEPKEAEASGETAEKGKDQPAKKEKPEEVPPRSNGLLETDYKARGANLDVLCTPAQVVEIAKILDAAGFFLEIVSGVDWINEDQMEVIYDYSIVADIPCRVVVRTRVPRSEPVVPTISGIFPGANWHERETHEFFGIKFEGHPNLVPLLLPEDADFHPLRKDFKL
ncbi:MAG: NADH-quinone oxidoreductase subunit C [Desulfobulbaceae bacterium]|nr:NADH-quinone oxidoreductase subunit C [Desulfobulbaceae bacterium]